VRPKHRLDRRRLLLRGAALSAAAATLLVLPRLAQATPQGAAELVRKLVHGALRQGRINLQLPEIADNGNAVPLTVSVESPMTEADHVTAIHVVADGNPNAGVFSARLGPANGKAELSTRIRLSSSQTVIALAEMSDGSVWTASREVAVTIGGCGG
jgi:sulfur-oxidizing protein SoxY